MDNFDRILEKMDKEGINASLYVKNENIFYLSGFKPSSFSLLLLKDDPVLFASKMDLEESQNISTVPVEEFKSFSDLKSLLNDLEIKNLGLEDSLTLGIFEKISGDWKFSTKDILSSFRMIKSPQEINKITKAISIAEKSIKQLEIKGTELDVVAQLEYNMKINGSQKEAFDTIVASGPRSSLPHSRPSHNLIESPLLIDWGAVWDNYCSDCTRTMVETEKQEEIKKILLEALRAGIKSIKPGVPVSEVDTVVRDIIIEYGYGDNFIHSTGHGVGLEVHEAPSLSVKDDLKIEKNMVVTVEPGIYLEGEFGIRVEDMVLVKNKAKILTNLSHDLNF